MDSIRTQMERAAAMRREGELAAAHAHREESRQRLLRIVEKKAKTIFIGAVSACEEHLGAEVWGHGRPESELSPAQLSMRKAWEACRNEILNNGNRQLRALEKELRQHTVNWDGYHTQLRLTEEDSRS